MPIVIPLRFVTALAGLIIGYYVGFFVDDKSRAQDNFRRFYHTLSSMYGSRVPTVDYSDEDEAEGLFFTSTYLDESDEETEYSDDED